MSSAQPAPVTVNWLDNDKLAREMFAKGHAFELVVAAFFRAHGLSVTVGEQSVRDSVHDRDQYRAEIDLCVAGVSVEVKSRNVNRWFDPMNLCSLRGWAEKKGKVGVWVIVSQKTGEMLVISGQKAMRHATVETTRDPGRGIESYKVVRVPLRHFSKPEFAIDWLKSVERMAKQDR